MLPPHDALIASVLMNLNLVFHICTCPQHSAELLDFIVMESGYGFPQ